MIVQVHHTVHNKLTGNPEGHEHIANVFITGTPININTALEYAYRWTQNIEGSWSMEPTISHQGQLYDNPDYNPAVEVLKPLRTWSDGRVMGHRSTMLYDLMIVDGVTYEVSAFGFREMEIA